MERPIESFINMESAIKKEVDEMTRQRYESSCKYLFEEIEKFGKKIQIQILITCIDDDFVESEPLNK